MLLGMRCCRWYLRVMTEQVQPEKRQFKAIAGHEYEAMDAVTRDRVVRTRHLGILQNSEVKVTSILKDALTQPRATPDGAVVPPYSRGDIVMLLIHRDDPIFPVELRETLEDQDLEVAIFAAERETFANHLLNFSTLDPAGKSIRPYRRAGKVLATPPPELCVYFAVFDCGMCTVTFMGFDPEQKMETVPVDPNAKLPEPVDPMPTT